MPLSAPEKYLTQTAAQGPNPPAEAPSLSNGPSPPNLSDHPAVQAMWQSADLLPARCQARPPRRAAAPQPNWNRRTVAEPRKTIPPVGPEAVVALRPMPAGPQGSLASAAGPRSTRRPVAGSNQSAVPVCQQAGLWCCGCTAQSAWSSVKPTIDLGCQNRTRASRSARAGGNNGRRPRLDRRLAAGLLAWTLAAKRAVRCCCRHRPTAPQIGFGARAALRPAQAP